MMTEKQLRVARLLALGMSTRQIARQLDLSTSTVQFHIANIADRLKINKRERDRLSAALLVRGPR